MYSSPLRILTREIWIHELIPFFITKIIWKFCQVNLFRTSTKMTGIYETFSRFRENSTLSMEVERQLISVLPK